MTYIKGEVKVRHEQIELPHSCDAWVIGGIEEAETMIADLKEAIETLRNMPVA